MTPDAVLTDDQKIIRFRKTLLKRRQVSESNEQTVGSGEEEGEEADDEDENMRSINSISPSISLQTAVDDHPEILPGCSTNPQIPKKIPRLEELIESLSSDDDMNEKTSTNIVDNVSTVGTLADISRNYFQNDNLISDYSPSPVENLVDNSSNLIDNSSNLIDSSSNTVDNYSKIPHKLRSKIDLIDRALQITFMQMKSATSDQLVKKLEALQAGDSSVSIGKSEILANIVQISELFRHFALLHR
jgi:hypothetical protein